ncbi:MAG: cytidine deaminase [Lachnospiraceae bacterium]|nr:cytidine deaminase [Lachnospiraceae bacterium]
MTNEEMLKLAKEVSKKAYSPYSKVQVGAVLLVGNEKIYTGVNVENSSYGGTICAERTAFVKAISEGERQFKKIAVAGSIRNLVPCGICRQFMSEFNKELEVIYEDEAGNMVVTNLSELFPHGFSL